MEADPIVEAGKAVIAGEESEMHPAVPPGYWRRHACAGRSTGARCFPYEDLHGTLGLVKLGSLAHGFPRAKV